MTKSSPSETQSEFNVKGIEKRGSLFSPLDDPHRFAEALENWFKLEGLDYPWRRTTDPYAILVSELMLQQTQISTVLQGRYYERWMALFPTVETLANASEETILKAWEGLGYYRRARFLQQSAKSIQEQNGGVFPRTLQEIHELPGVGRYTTGAVLSFAFDQPAPIVDGNVERVLARLMNFSQEIDSKTIKEIWNWAEQLVKESISPRRFNSALMELGQQICKATSTDCMQCPVKSFCRCTNPLSLPNKKSAPVITHIEEHAALVSQDGKILLVQEIGTRRQGLWKFPPLNENKSKMFPKILELKYSITRYRVLFHLYGATFNEIDLNGINQKGWFNKEEGEAIALASPYRKAWNKLWKYIEI